MSNVKVETFIIKPIESILVIGFIIFEELIWNNFAKPVFQYLKSLIVLDALKEIFLGMNRYLLVSVFLFILAITEYLGVLSGIVIIKGQMLLGVFIYALKVPIAAMTFWLFDVTKDELMSFNWLKASYEYIMGLMDKLIHSSIYINIKKKALSAKENLKIISDKYLGKGSFLESAKAHYIIFKSHIIKRL